MDHPHPSAPLITHENHLDHMVRVVPLVFTFYVIQSFIMMKINPTSFTQNSLVFLGIFLAGLIAALYFYDSYHQVHLAEDKITMIFLGRKEDILISDIDEIIIKNNESSFSTLTLKTKDKKINFFFVDYPEKVKEKIEGLKKDMMKMVA